MKIGISLFQFFPGRVGGAGEYIARVVPRLLDRLEPHDQLYLCGNAENLAPFSALQDDRLIRIRFSLRKEMLAVRRLADLVAPGWGGRGLAARINALGLDVMLFPQQSLFPHGIAAQKVVTVVDLLHERFPQHFGPLGLWIRRRKDRLLARHSDRTICISQATRADLLMFQCVAPERAVVVRLGGNERPPLPEPAAPSAEPYILYPANAYPHKNHARLIRAFQRYKQQGPAAPGKLILSGLGDKRLVKLLRSGSAHGIEHVGYVSRDRLAALYAGCAAVVIPSLFEGFGIPLVEALGFGKKVFCADLPVFRELAGDAVEYFDATSEESLATVCARALSQPQWPVDQAAYARILGELNWDHCARQTYEVLAGAVGSQPAVEPRRRAA
jgi:glycosyltransferase involved in cell wall biosynthesis